MINGNQKVIWKLSSLLLLIHRLEFKETPTLEEIQIDNESKLKWCPNFISKEEGDALFDHLMEGNSINTKRKNQQFYCPSFIFRVEFRAHCNFYLWKTCQPGKKLRSCEGSYWNSCHLFLPLNYSLVFNRGSQKKDWL